jgi:hypothetical protein
MIGMKIATRWLLILAFTFGRSRMAHAAESYDNCTGFISSLPAVISTQGVWCLRKDLSTAITSGNAIDIEASNVTIDCNDFKLGGLAAGIGTQTNGIFSVNHINATVRHCNIRGFAYGLSFVEVDASGGHTIEDNRFDGNTISGIEVDGDGSVVRRNRVFDTGGSTNNPHAYGITTRHSIDVLDNTVSGIVARSGSDGSAYGIMTYDNLDGSVNGNRVRGLLKAGTGSATAIAGLNSDRISLRNNDLVGDAGVGSVGLGCANSNGSATNNVINGFATAIQLCSDDGGNVIAP